MLDLNRVHAKAVMLYICLPLFFIMAWLVSVRLLHILIPPNIIVGISLLSFLVPARMRISVWLNKRTLLTEEEKKTINTRVFLLIIPFEILVSILGVVFFFV